MRFLPIGERTDPPECPERKFHCPICSTELDPFDTVYVAEDGQALGCENCVKEADARDVEETSD